jgi:hypothetical protein
MTPQNEKLRALLVEARIWVAPGSHTRARIDAALAEPVAAEYVFRGGYIEDSSGDRWWSAELLSKVERERDEARAEVERLKIVLDSIRAARSLLGQLQDHVSDHACAEMMCILSDEPLNADGEPYITPSQQAYRRGAEAMREAAADLFQGNKPGLAAMPAWSAFIRALPIPEDKP